MTKRPASGVVVTDVALMPVVAIDLDGVLRIPNVKEGAEFRADARTVDITMRRDSFPTYSHLEPPWDANGAWTGTHTFTEVGAQWVRSLSSRGVATVWATRWRAYANVYFAAALELPLMPFIDVPGDDVEFPLLAARWLSRRFRGRPLLWVTANPTSHPGTRLEELRRPGDAARSRVLVPDEHFGISSSDALAMDAWLDLASSDEGQAELRSRRRRLARARAARQHAAWGSQARYRRWRAARSWLTPALGSDSTLLTLLADYVLERGDDIDPADIVRLRIQWGHLTDPPASGLLGLIAAAQGDPPRADVVAWVGHGYPPAMARLADATGESTLRVGLGWWPLLGRLHEQLAAIDPEYTVSSVRAGADGLRFEAESSAPHWYGNAFHRLIRAAKAEAARTCERCGRRGSRIADTGARDLVLCDEHARPLTHDEVASALDAGVPPGVFASEGAVEGALSGTPGTLGGGNPARAVEPLQPGEEEIYRLWVRIRTRLEAVLGEQSGLTAPLAAYAAEHVHRLRLSTVRVIREEYGVAAEPSAEELLPLLEVEDDSVT